MQGIFKVAENGKRQIPLISQGLGIPSINLVKYYILREALETTFQVPPFQISTLLIFTIKCIHNKRAS
jgi:hypothetical protein